MRAGHATPARNGTPETTAAARRALDASLGPNGSALPAGFPTGRRRSRIPVTRRSSRQGHLANSRSGPGRCRRSRERRSAERTQRLQRHLPEALRNSVQTVRVVTKRRRDNLRCHRAEPARDPLIERLRISSDVGPVAEGPDQRGGGLLRLVLGPISTLRPPAPSPAGRITSDIDDVTPCRASAENVAPHGSACEQGVRKSPSASWPESDQIAQVLVGGARKRSRTSTSRKGPAGLSLAGAVCALHSSPCDAL